MEPFSNDRFLELFQKKVNPPIVDVSRLISHKIISGVNFFRRAYASSDVLSENTSNPPDSMVELRTESRSLSSSIITTFGRRFIWLPANVFLKSGAGADTNCCWCSSDLRAFVGCIVRSEWKRMWMFQDELHSDWRFDAQQQAIVLICQWESLSGLLHLL